MLAAGTWRKQMVDDVVALLDKDDTHVSAAQRLADELNAREGLSLPPVTKKIEADELLTLLMHWLFDNDGYEEVSQILWGRNLFDVRPEGTQRIWKAMGEDNFILIQGGGSVSKSFSCGVRLFLEWIRDPEYTFVQVLGPSETHLEQNLFTHLVTLHRNSRLPLPGEIQQLFIGLDPRQRKSSISGVAVPLGKKASGKLQGTKREPRRMPHPKFGAMSRMFIFLDEIALIPPGIWKDIENLITGSSGGGLKIIGAYNPHDISNRVAVQAEPVNGWQEFDPEKDFDWVSKRGWRVIRLDPERCENVVEGREIFPGLVTREALERLASTSGGKDSAGYWTMGRGCFPPTGVPMSIIPPGLLVDLLGEFIWYDRPTPCGGVDMALQGGDVAPFVKGSFGLASGIKFPPTLKFPGGRTVMFKDHRGMITPRFAIQVETMIEMPLGDTIMMKDEIIRLSREFGIRADYLCVDRTGNGQGVYDLLRHEYGFVIGVNYSESASDTKIMQEDQATPKELYDRAATELWFGAKRFVEFAIVKISPGFPTLKLFPQLTGRRFRTQGKRAKVEAKDVYQSRNSATSPDEADGFTLLIHGVRKATSIIPAIDPSKTVIPGDWEEDFDEAPGDIIGGARVSIENRFEDII